MNIIYISDVLDGIKTDTGGMPETLTWKQLSNMLTEAMKSTAVNRRFKKNYELFLQPVHSRIKWHCPFRQMDMGSIITSASVPPENGPTA